MNAATSVFLPTKFLLCIGQLILLVFVLVTYENYVYAGISEGLTPASSDFKKAKSRLLGCISLFFITLTAEFVAVFMGISVYFNKILAIQVVLHIFGCLSTALLLEREWNGIVLWGIWVVFGYG